MSDDLISRQAAIDAYLETVEPIAVQEWNGEISACARDRDVLKMLENLLSVQPKTGRWINISPLLTAARCSECKKALEDRTNFCPNCGAKMEGYE